MMETIDIPEIKEARKTLAEMQADRNVRLALISLEKQRSDQAAWEYEAKQKGREEGREEGRQEGRQEGREEERIKFALYLIGTGLDNEAVAKTTGLAESKVQELRGS